VIASINEGRVRPSGPALEEGPSRVAGERDGKLTVEATSNSASCAVLNFVGDLGDDDLESCHRLSPPTAVGLGGEWSEPKAARHAQLVVLAVLLALLHLGRVALLSRCSITSFWIVAGK